MRLRLSLPVVAVLLLLVCASPSMARQQRSAGIYAGFYWAEQTASADSLRVPLNDAAELAIDWIVGRCASELAPRGLYPGIPNRTLILVGRGWKLVYGGSMGDEFGVCSLSGDVLGFFWSEDLEQLLTEYERAWVRAEDGAQPN